jgi:hypothetical protein
VGPIACDGVPRKLTLINSLHATFDAVEVFGSSPHGPTIFFNGLVPTTTFGQAPIGSIKQAVRDDRGQFLIFLREDTGSS